MWLFEFSEARWYSSLRGFENSDNGIIGVRRVKKRILILAELPCLIIIRIMILREEYILVRIKFIIIRKL